MKEKKILKKVCSMLLAVALIVMIPFGGKVDAYGYVSDDPDVIETVLYSTNYIKVKDTVYFSADASGLISYNIKTGKKRKLSNNIVANIMYYKGYIYGNSLVYNKKGDLHCSLYRVNVKNGKEKKLMSNISNIGKYNISNDKLYVSGNKKNSDHVPLYSMNLDGTNKKKIIPEYRIYDGFSCNFTIKGNYIIFDKGYTDEYAYNITTKKTIKLLDYDYDKEYCSRYLSSDGEYYGYKDSKTKKYVYFLKNYDGKIIKTYKSKKKYEAALKLAEREDTSYTYRCSDSDVTIYDKWSWQYDEDADDSWTSGNKEYIQKSTDSSKIYCRNTTTNKQKCIYKANAKKYKGEKVISNTVSIMGVTGNYLLVKDYKETATKYIDEYKLITSSGKVITTLYTYTRKK